MPAMAFVQLLRLKMTAVRGLDSFSSQPRFHGVLGAFRCLMFLDLVLDRLFLPGGLAALRQYITCRKRHTGNRVVLRIAVLGDACNACAKIGQLLLEVAHSPFVCWPKASITCLARRRSRISFAAS